MTGSNDKLLELVADHVERVAKAIYGAAFNQGEKPPSPGWCWDRATDVQKEFCRKQAMAAIREMKRCLE